MEYSKSEPMPGLRRHPFLHSARVRLSSLLARQYEKSLQAISNGLGVRSEQWISAGNAARLEACVGKGVEHMKEQAIAGDSSCGEISRQTA